MNEMTVYDVNQDIVISRPPEAVLSEAQRAAKSLADVVSNKKKPVIMNGEQYLEFEDWQTVGRFYGVTAKVVSTEFMDLGGVQGFLARAVAIRADGMEISAAEAMCMNDEPNWKSKPLFQLRSMAQTRACAKSLRNVLAWVVVLAGYRATPAEEMQDTASAKPEQKPPAKPGKKSEKADAEHLTVVTPISDIESKEGVNQRTNKPYTIYGIKDAKDVIYKTFDSKFADIASEVFAAGGMVKINYTIGQYGNNIVSLEAVAAQ